MFDSTYFDRVHQVDRRPGSSEKHICTKLYSFKGSTSIYIVEVDEYRCDVYILKFYSKNHKASANKFNLLTEENDAQGVIRTVLDIAVDIFENENQQASFGFIGAHKIKENFEEDRRNTQRFRVYRDIMKNYFGDETWHHFESVDSSSYLMLNRIHADFENVVKEIAEMFKSIYNEFEGSVIRLE